MIHQISSDSIKCIEFSTFGNSVYVVRLIQIVLPEKKTLDIRFLSLTVWTVLFVLVQFTRNLFCSKPLKSNIVNNGYGNSVIE